MKIKLLLFVLVFLFVFVFPTTADTNQEINNISYEDLYPATAEILSSVSFQKLARACLEHEDGVAIRFSSVEEAKIALFEARRRYHISEKAYSYHGPVNDEILLEHNDVNCLFIDDDCVTVVTCKNEQAYSNRFDENLEETCLKRLQDWISNCHISDLDTDINKVAKLCACIEEHVTYDYSLLHKHWYDAVMYGDTVCNGYAELLLIMCKFCDVSCKLVAGYTPNGEYHAWNIVMINDSEYPVDVTWADNGQNPTIQDIWARSILYEKTTLDSDVVAYRHVATYFSRD